MAFLYSYWLYFLWHGIKFDIFLCLVKTNTCICIMHMTQRKISNCTKGNIELQHNYKKYFSYAYLREKHYCTNFILKQIINTDVITCTDHCIQLKLNIHLIKMEIPKPSVYSISWKTTEQHAKYNQDSVCSLGWFKL